MRFQRIDRSDPDKVFVACKNASSTALVDGNCVVWAYNGTDDGIAVDFPTTALQPAIAGLVNGSIAVGGYGEVQVYGHHANASVKGYSTDTVIAVGKKLEATNAQVYLSFAASTTVASESGVVICGEEVASLTTLATGVSVFIRCM